MQWIFLPLSQVLLTLFFVTCLHSWKSRRWQCTSEPSRKIPIGLGLLKDWETNCSHHMCLWVSSRKPYTEWAWAQHSLRMDASTLVGNRNIRVRYSSPFSFSSGERDVGLSDLALKPQISDVRCSCLPGWCQFRSSRTSVFGWFLGWKISIANTIKSVRWKK